MEETLSAVRASAARRVLFLPHAVRQMSRRDRMISAAEVVHVVDYGEVIEDYPADARGHSCLLFAMCEGRPIHVVCAPKGDYLAVITAYVPEDDEWNADWKTRIRE